MYFYVFCYFIFAIFFCLFLFFFFSLNVFLVLYVKYFNKNYLKNSQQFKHPVQIISRRNLFLVAIEVGAHDEKPYQRAITATPLNFAYPYFHKRGTSNCFYLFCLFNLYAAHLAIKQLRYKCLMVHIRHIFQSDPLMAPNYKKNQFSVSSSPVDKTTTITSII